MADEGLKRTMKYFIHLRKEQQKQQQQVKQQHRQKEVQVKKVNIPLELIVTKREQRMCMNIMIIMRRKGRDYKMNFQHGMNLRRNVYDYVSEEEAYTRQCVDLNLNEGRIALLKLARENGFYDELAHQCPYIYKSIKKIYKKLILLN